MRYGECNRCGKKNVGFRYKNGIETCNNCGHMIVLCNTESSPIKIKNPVIEINFDGNLKCQIEISVEGFKVLKAVNGFGNNIDPNLCTIKEIQ